MSPGHKTKLFFFLPNPPSKIAWILFLFLKFFESFLYLLSSKFKFSNLNLDNLNFFLLKEMIFLVKAYKIFYLLFLYFLP